MFSNRAILWMTLVFSSSKTKAREHAPATKIMKMKVRRTVTNESVCLEAFVGKL